VFVKFLSQIHVTPSVPRRVWSKPWNKRKGSLRDSMPEDKDHTTALTPTFIFPNHTCRAGELLLVNYFANTKHQIDPQIERDFPVDKLKCKTTSFRQCAVVRFRGLLVRKFKLHRSGSTTRYRHVAAPLLLSCKVQ
jgi:hypothetical protein